MLRPVGIAWARDDSGTPSVVGARLRDTDRLDDQDLLELALASATAFESLENSALSAGGDDTDDRRRRPSKRPPGKRRQPKKSGDISGLGKLVLDFASASEEEMNDELGRSMDVKREPNSLVNQCLRLLGSGNYGVVMERCALDSSRANCDTGACVAIKFQVDTSTTALETKHATDLSIMRETSEFVPRIFGSRTFYAPKYGKSYHATIMEVLRSPYPTVTHLLTEAPRQTVESLLPHVMQRVLAGLVAVQSVFPLLRHNDLGPYNVFLDGPDSRRVLLGDWGLSFDVDADRRSKTSTLAQPWVLWTVEENRRNHVLVNIDTHERRVVTSDDEMLDDELIVSYVAPIWCEYYDFFYFVYRVHRALLKRFGPVDGFFASVERVRMLMFRNRFVLDHPDFEDLVAKSRFPGRLTTLMQVEIQSAIARGELPSLKIAYDRLFG